VPLPVVPNAIPHIGTDQHRDAVAGLAAGFRELVRDAPRLLTLGGLRGVIAEAAWWSVHFVTYPWGLLRESHEPSDRYHLRGLAPAQRGLLHHNLEAAGTPILLVHGIIDNHAIFAVLKRRLRRKGFGTVVTINYSPTTNDIRQAATVLAREVEAIVALTGYERVHVVGHSLGGLIARYYVQRLGGDERVHTLVTLGTPHRGSLHAHLLPVRIGRQLRPASDLMTELELPARGCRTRFVAYWSDFDQIIVPRTSARLDHPDLGARNIQIHNIGHLAIPRQGQVAHEIAGLMSQLDHDGHTLAAGITPLGDGSAARPDYSTRPSDETA
jgi:pimeloyl-ACP methyl ester carboxylesterase